jgi:hypothetical protein
MDIQLEATFTSLEALLYPYQQRLYVTRNDSCRYSTKLSSPPCFRFQASFADSRHTEHDVLYVLYPLKHFGFLNKNLSSVIVSRQSATTFVLTSMDQRVLNEFACLTHHLWTTLHGLLPTPTESLNLALLMSADQDSMGSRLVN